jgi:hypothetical protein
MHCQPRCRQVVRAHWRACITLNLIYYGQVLVGTGCSPS